METNAKDFLKGQGAIFLCAFLWSTSGLFIKLISWHPVLIAGSRSLIAALFMLVLRLVMNPKTPLKTGFGFWAGGVCYALTMVTFVIANKLTTSANAILLQYTAPVWAAVLGWAFIREKPHWEHWCALAAVLGGMILFFKDGIASGHLAGDLLAVLSGILFGAQSVFLRMQKHANPSDSLLFAHLVCCIISVPFIFTHTPLLSVSSAFSILFMGVIQIGCASVLFSYGIKRVKAIQAMLSAMIEPVMNPVWVLLVTGEKPTAPALAGGAVIITAVIASSLIGKRRDSGVIRP
jgi:drug/metabolite transporter (DMT)-like permease